jgi:hypothetical protein
VEEIDDAICGVDVLEHKANGEWNGSLSPEQVITYLSSIYNPFSNDIGSNV